MIAAYGVVGGYFAAIGSDEHDQQIVWKFKTGHEIFGTIGIGSDNSVYVGSVDGFVYCLDSKGWEKWRFDTKSSIDTDIAVDNQSCVYVGARDFYAINPQGKLRWKFSSRTGATSAAAIGNDGTVYVSIDDNLCAIAPNGELKWKQPILGRAPSLSPIIGADGNIYVDSHKSGSAMGRLDIFRQNGDLQGRFEIRGIFGGSPAADVDGNVYVVLSVGDSPGLYSVDKHGKANWSFNRRQLKDAPVIGPDRTVYIGSLDGFLYAVNPDGTMRWQFKATAGILCSPVIGGDGCINFASGNKICTVSPNGKLKSEFEISPKWRCGAAPVIDHSGTMFVGSIDGLLYALTGFAPPPQTGWPMKRHDAQGTARAMTSD